MFPPDKARESLALRQAALVNALIRGSPPPPGFDSRRLQAAANSLACKRSRSAGRAWPGLAHGLGEKFQEQFAAYAVASPLPGQGGPLADGHAFARWLLLKGHLPEAGQMEATAVALRYRYTTEGLVPRRWPALRLAWFRRSRRVALAIRIPRIGERWFGFAIRGISRLEG